MKLAWITDPHLEWIDQGDLDRFLKSVARSKTEGIIISGDISVSKHLPYHLSCLAQLPSPVYFVLGNHDFWGGSFKAVQDMVRTFVRKHRNLVWLTESDPIHLTAHTALIGQDGWSDGRAGLGEASGFFVKDFFLIRELAGLGVSQAFEVMRNIADKASLKLYKQITQTDKKQFLVVTHCPPFGEAALYRDKKASDKSLPHFSNLGMGMLLKKASEKTGAKLFILCGHTHNKATIDITNLIHVRVLGARYGHPSFSIIDIE